MIGKFSPSLSNQCGWNSGTGKMVSWHVTLGDPVVDQPVAPAICSNDELFELQAVLAAKVAACGETVAPFVRDGRLVPVLTEQMPQYAGYFVYFGTRTSQPARARAIIDLAM